LTKAGKLLELAQPSLSQQITKLEDEVGTPLFSRNRNAMELTEAGRFLLRKTEAILAGVDEAVAGLEGFREGTRGGMLAVGALNSVARAVIPRMTQILRPTYPELQVDVHEVPPAEAIDLLYGRRLNVAMIAADSIASSALSFQQSDILRDAYVLAVPACLDLSGVGDPARDLSGESRRILHSLIQFSFGTQHALQMEQWYRRVLPRAEAVAQTRTYELALSMVEAGIGVAVVPALAASGQVDGGRVRLFRTDLPERRVIALLPSQYARAGFYADVVRALGQAGSEVAPPAIAPMPPFMANAGVEAR
jgi:DNA-binding transcriptional LysR family regulator